MDTNTNIYEVVMENFRARRIRQRDVAIGSGVPFSTVTKIAQGQIKAPNVHHVQALYDFFMRANAAGYCPHCCGHHEHQEAT